MSFKQFIRFTNDAGGLEKVLRLLQSLAQILAAYAFTVEDAVFWMHLRRQFALGRRYFRFFRFLTCFSRVHESFLNLVGLPGILETGKWSFMGAYLLLESVTILDAVGAWPTPWAEVCLLEANRFWFYSLVLSILSAVLSICERDSEDTKEETEKTKEMVSLQKKRVMKGIKWRLIADSFDILIPGHVIGWIPSSLALAGFASVISTLLSSKDIWDRVQ